MKLKTMIISILLIFVMVTAVSCTNSSSEEKETENIYDKYKVDKVYGGSPEKSHIIEAKIVEFIGLKQVIVKVVRTDDENLFVDDELVYVEVWDYSYYDAETNEIIGSLGYDEKKLPEDMKIDVGDVVNVRYYWSDLQIGDEGLVKKNDMKLLKASEIEKIIDTSKLEKTDIPEWLIDRRCSYVEAIIMEVRSYEPGPEEELMVEVQQDYGGKYDEYVEKGERVLVDYELYSLQKIKVSFRNPDVASSISMELGEELDEKNNEYELKVGDRIIVLYDIVDEKEGMIYYRLCRIIKPVY